MKQIYFWNQKNQNFELNEIPEWVGYEPMVDVATDALTLIKENKDFQTVLNIREALNLIDCRYGSSDAEYFYHKNIREVASTLANILQYTRLLEWDQQGKDTAGYTVKEKKDIQRVIDNLFTKAETKLLDLSKGVVYVGDRFYHITDPSQDIYTYNGRDFYMWDGWHSSKKVMEGMADKCFNE